MKTTNIPETEQQKGSQNRMAAMPIITFGQAVTVPAPANDNAEVADKNS